jgi:hypothetical protein
MTKTLEHTLISTITSYDKKQSTKKSYNRLSLGKYMVRLDNTLSEAAQGVPIDQALAANFNGNILEVLLRAVRAFEDAKVEDTRVG